MIEVKHLSKRFGDFTAVDDITFSIGERSGITGLLGPNGAGKTTTMRLLTGYLQPSSGEIRMNGLSPEEEEARVEIKRNIGYLPETSPLYPEMLVSEFLEFMGRARGLAGARLETAGRNMVDLLELGSHFYTPIGILSKGFRQRVALAGVLIHDPRIIILDEPTSGLDPNQIAHIRTLLRELSRDRTLILSTHILQEVEDICERVIIISRGRITADASAAVLKGDVLSYNLVARGGREKPGEMARKLEALPFLQSCEALEGEPAGAPGYHRFSCVLTEDSPEKLFSWISQTGWEARELSPVSRTLHDFFQESTS